MDQFEYKHVVEPVGNFTLKNTIEGYLNIMGRNGWELAALLPVHSATMNVIKYEFFFKRKKQ